MADPMKIRANVVGDSTEVKVLMNVKVTHNDKVVLNAQWGPAVAKNPFLSFKFKGGAKGDKVKITWVDNRSDTRTDEATIA